MTVALAGLVAGFVHVCLGPITWQGLRRTPWTDWRGPRRWSSRAA